MIKKQAPALLLILLLLGGCSPKEKEGANASIPPASPDASMEERKESLSLNPIGSTEQATGPADSFEAALEPLPMGIREKLSHRRLPRPILPEDRKIGPLGGGSEEEPVLAPLRRLFDGLSEGTVDSTLLLPELKEYLSRILEEFPSGDLTYRLGRVNFLEEGRTAVNCRLLRPLAGRQKASGSGEVHLEFSGGAWRIAAIDIDFLELTRPYSRDPVPFEPRTYRWLELY